MKAYVIEYGPMRDDPQRFEVQYASDLNPESRYSSRQCAEAACRSLNGFEIRLGTHRCAYAIDCLSDGHFALFCVCHPHCTSTHSSVLVSQHVNGSMRDRVLFPHCRCVFVAAWGLRSDGARGFWKSDLQNSTSTSVT